jgi:hypothetical protein
MDELEPAVCATEVLAIPFSKGKTPSKQDAAAKWLVEEIRGYGDYRGEHLVTWATVSQPEQQQCDALAAPRSAWKGSVSLRGQMLPAACMQCMCSGASAGVNLHT